MTTPAPRPDGVKVFHGIAELEQAVGTHLGYSGWHTVTQQQIDTFAEATGDHQWIHVDPVRAAGGPFGTTIAHGYLTLSLVPMLVWEIYTVEGITMGVNYGSNKVRFPAPVPVGSKLRAGVELVSVTPGSGGYQVVARVTVEREGGDRPVCVADAVSVLVP
ncbi:MaoC family dehydratase [Streptacidiphilus rugosus]|uniref:MaoC family dehydratase n=1 Tax=Streptacidiphilus rugosus TaxID=405783 RepID=UPI000B100709|nr:MaoC family dehydratase [Streptacidiphilus rugosus]